MVTQVMQSESRTFDILSNIYVVEKMPADTAFA